MGKYLKTKEGSVESAVLEAMNPAQQAAIAISKKKKAGKPGYDDQGKSLKNDVETDEELSAKQKKIDLNKNGKIDGDDLAKLRKKADKKEEETVKTEAMKPVKANHYDVEVTVSDRDVYKVKKIIQNFRGEIEDVDSDQVDGGGMKFKGTGKIFIMGDDAGKLGMEIAKAVRSVKVMGEEKEVDEGKMKDMAMKIDDIVAKMKKDSKMKSFADKFKKDAMKSMDVAKSLEKVLPDYVAGKDIQKLMASYEEVQEETLAMRTAKAISDMWAEASKSPKEEEEEMPKKKESKKTTMTGKPMADIEINPKSKTEDK
tara:strand:- start:584 stop:1522 length:939 start_codon:yes stop_codon:yes gene_type:complete